MKHTILIIFSLLISTVTQSQPYSIDIPPKTTQKISFRKIFQREPKEIRKAKREQRKKEKKENYNEIKTKKKYWKRVNKPEELGTNRKIHKRMKKNLRRAERINKNKHPDSFFVRMSKKKIKLPKIYLNIKWPWTKKLSNN